MIRQYELVERVRRYKPDVDEDLLNKAYVYAMQKHSSQKRASGAPYFSHPLEVAAILTNMHLDEATIAVALLHDTLEDTTATREEIDEIFGPEIGNLVEGLTKIDKLDLVSKKAIQAENLRKLLIAVCQDVRILLVKLADRLHNMRTLMVMSEQKRQRIAQETMDIYAPLAGRMGMRDISEELQDLAFQYLNPEAYKTITNRLKILSENHKDLLKIIQEELVGFFSKHGITATVKSRQKRPYSVFHKMETKGVAFEQLSDIFGFRVIVDDVSQCYQVLGIIHTTWPMVPGKFKDYISTPKENGYASLHTTIVGPSCQRVELQIRTYEMDKIAEYGVAAHAIYKDRGSGAGGEKLAKETTAYAWLRQTVELLSEGANPEEFLEHTKLELFQDQVFCFTPKGRVISLPRGAIPIDFAYAIHTDVGNSCVGVKINGRPMPLMTPLNNGDEVEIICSTKRIPPASWEKLAKTGKARAAVRRATRVAVSKQYSEVGYQILEQAFERAGKNFDKDALKLIHLYFMRKDMTDLLVGVARGEILPKDILKAIYPDYQDDRATKKASAQKKEKGWFNIQNAAGMLFKIPTSSKKPTFFSRLKQQRTNQKVVPISGIQKNTAVRFSPEGAVPGDRIIGILDQKNGIVIYPIQSKALMRYENEPERWIDVRWDIDPAMTERFPVRVRLLVVNVAGALASVTHAIAANDGNIKNLTITHNALDFTEIQLDLEVWNLKHLNRILLAIRAVKVVNLAERLYG